MRPTRVRDGKDQQYSILPRRQWGHRQPAPTMFPVTHSLRGAASSVTSLAYLSSPPFGFLLLCMPSLCASDQLITQSLTIQVDTSCSLGGSSPETGAGLHTDWRQNTGLVGVRMWDTSMSASLLPPLQECEVREGLALLFLCSCSLPSPLDP